jgi:hypothetical protein
MWSRRKRVHPFFAPNLEVLSSSHIYFQNENQILGTPVIFHGSIDILNASPHDLSYFDLRAFNPRKNINYGVVTRKTLPSTWVSGISIQVDSWTSGMLNVEIPDKNYGNLPAHSFTRLDILIYESKDSGGFEDHILLMFKIPKKNWFVKDPYAATNRKKFKAYSCLYTITNWKNALELRGKSSVQSHEYSQER